MMDFQLQKAQLRDAIRKRLGTISEKDRKAESRSLCRRVAEAFPNEPLTVCAFVPMPDETLITPLLRGILKRSDALFLPRYEQGRLVFRKVGDLRELAPGAFDIPEPPATALELDPSVLQIALVPGRAFDRKGNRLGRGNGGYDHWIACQRRSNPKARFWGVCLECQLMQEVPAEAHDERVDAVITARGILIIDH